MIFNNASFFANSIWHTASWWDARRFWRAAVHPAETQERLLRSYLEANQATEYGRRYNFGGVRSAAGYQRHAPLTTYDDYAGDIARLAQGERNVLTAAPVQLFERSSGSTAASKLIPYTATLKREFQRGLAPWICDLFTAEPALKAGPAYWSITPLTGGCRTTPAGIPIGFEEDSAYLGPLGRIVETVLAVPDRVKHISDIVTFRYLTLLFLLRQPGLRLISVWNPTFLTLLLSPLADWWNRLLADIAQGTVTPPCPLEPALARRLRSQLQPAPRRAQQLSGIDPHRYSEIWRRLRLISCWADGAAGAYAGALAQRFPGAILQGKGLLATEAFVSFPLMGKTGSVLAITSHFFEFLAADGAIHLAHELKIGQSYEVIITTGGGFYRYQLHDKVEVVDFAGATPCIRFIGKTDHISDYFGEKLNEQFVAAVLAQIFAAHHLAPTFALLAPHRQQDKLHYTLYIELSSTQQTPPGLADALEQALMQNFHYAYCRQLGQLAAAQATAVTNGVEAYLRHCRQRGRKLGNIKPALLDNQTGWEAVFANQ
jgi:hypothetical protein